MFLFKMKRFYDNRNTRLPYLVPNGTIVLSPKQSFIRPKSVINFIYCCFVALMVVLVINTYVISSTIKKIEVPDMSILPILITVRSLLCNLIWLCLFDVAYVILCQVVLYAFLLLNIVLRAEMNLYKKFLLQFASVRNCILIFCAKVLLYLLIPCSRATTNIIISAIIYGLIFLSRVLPLFERKYHLSIRNDGLIVDEDNKINPVVTMHGDIMKVSYPARFDVRFNKLPVVRERYQIVRVEVSGFCKETIFKRRIFRVAPDVVCSLLGKFTTPDKIGKFGNNYLATTNAHGLKQEDLNIRSDSIDLACLLAVHQQDHCVYSNF